MKLLIDEHFPPRLVKVLQILSEDLGLSRVDVPKGVRGDAPPVEEDWIVTCGREGGWCGMTQDYDILRERAKPPYIAWQQQGLPLLVFRDEWCGMGASEMLVPILRHWDTLLGLIRTLHESDRQGKVARVIKNGGSLSFRRLKLENDRWREGERMKQSHLASRARGRA